MKSLILLFITLSLAAVLPASAEETQIMLRAKAHDAKFIGSSVGGVKVVVEDAETGEILDQGWIKGKTGDTTSLIKEPIKRGQTLSSDDTAGFIAKVDINTPRLLRFKLIGPYGYRQSLQEATVTSWVVPGKHLLGDGITLNMPGFIMDAWTQVLEGGKVEFYTQSSMLCGCPITKDGLWNGNDYEAMAIIMQDEQILEEVPLTFKGPFGMYTGSTTIKESGYYKAIIYIIDQKTGNVGVDRTMFSVELK